MPAIDVATLHNVNEALYMHVPIVTVLAAAWLAPPATRRCWLGWAVWASAARSGRRQGGCAAAGGVLVPQTAERLRAPGPGLRWWALLVSGEVPSQRLALGGTQEQQQLASDGTQEQQQLTSDGTQEQQRQASAGTPEQQRLASAGTPSQQWIMSVVCQGQPPPLAVSGAVAPLADR